MRYLTHYMKDPKELVSINMRLTDLDLFGGVAFLALLFKNSNLFRNLIATKYIRKAPSSKQLNNYNGRY